MVIIGILAEPTFLIRGFDTNMIIAITLVARAAGGMAHWRESLRKLSANSPTTPLRNYETLKVITDRPAEQPVKLWRPQQIYVPLLKNEQNCSCIA